MLGPISIAAGAVLMILGVFSSTSWVSGKSRWLDSDDFDRRGTTLNDRQYLRLYFVALVIAPLLVGAILIVYGLTLVL